MVEVMKILVTSFKRSHACTTALSAPKPAAATAKPHLRQRLLDIYRQIWVSLLWGHWCTQCFVCALQESVSPVLCKFWWPCGEVNGNLLQEGLCHTQVCCTQSPCPCGSPLLTHTSAGDTQTQFLLSLCGVSESWCTQGLFQPSEHLWQVWGLILNVVSPLLPPCWGFSALGHGISPQRCSILSHIGKSITLRIRSQILVPADTEKPYGFQVLIFPTTKYGHDIRYF